MSYKTSLLNKCHFCVLNNCPQSCNLQFELFPFLKPKSQWNRIIRHIILTSKISSHSNSKPLVAQTPGLPIKH